MTVLKRALRRHRKRACLALITLAAMVPGLAQAAPSLTDAQRRAYLEYYAPLLMKRGNGNNGDAGRDWMANFDYDRDGIFANNGANFRANLPHYIAASRSGNLNHPIYKNWRMRPTMYTSLIEFMEGSRKDLVLIYHVYHPHDEEARGRSQLHDWERIEIRVKNVSGAPGTGDYADFVVITNHHRSLVRHRWDNDLQFMSTSTGRHVMIWQAEWSGKLYSSHGQELRFVQDSYAGEIVYRMNGTRDAEVDLTNHSSDKNVHYVFVPETSSAAVSAWRAKPLNFQTAYSLASTADNGNTIDWRDVKRITYELQDIADIVPTHWSGNDWSRHWVNDADENEVVRMRSGLTARQPGLNSIPGGRLETFYTKTKDVLNQDTREGYPNKSWFWGTYNIYRDACDNWNGVPLIGSTACPTGSFTSAARQNSFRDHYGYLRTTANDDSSGRLAKSWYQHDYFVHDGSTSDGRYGGDRGRWLRGSWYTAANGGFDGRWVQLFDDRPNDGGVTVAPAALNTSFSIGSTGCLGHTYAQVRPTGGRAPYTVTWRMGSSVVKTETTSSTSRQIVYEGQRGSVTVRDAAGTTKSNSFYAAPSCDGSYY